MAPSLAPLEWFNAVLAPQERTSIAFPLTMPEAQVSYTYNGSAALYQLTQGLNLSSGDAVLLPAYCCGAEIGPFEHIGSELLFYDVDEQLNAKIDQIRVLIQQRSDIKAILITHYFGFAQQDTNTIKTLCEESNIELLEDCAHSLFSLHGEEPLGSFGSHSIFSPRKSLPLSEGGLYIRNQLESVDKISNATAKPDTGPWLQRVLYSIQQYYRSSNQPSSNWVFTVLSIGMWGIPAISLKILKRIGIFKNSNWLTADAEGEEATAIYNVGMSTSMRKHLHCVDVEFIRNKRCENYHYWLHELGTDNTGLEARALFPRLPAGCCPLYFPLIVDNPADVVAELKLANIESFNWWQHMHSAVEWDQFPIAKKMKQSIVALPLHHKLGNDQIRRIAACVKATLKNQK